MKYILSAVLALLAIILYVNFKLPTKADIQSVAPSIIKQSPVVEQKHSSPVTPASHTSAYAPSFSGGVSHSNQRELFDRHISLAENGDADSMLIVAEVTEACAPIGSYKSWEQYAESDPLVQSGQMPVDMQDEFKSIFERMGVDCSYINGSAPDHRYSQWAGDWYKKAAAAGNVAARLRMLSVELPSEDNRQSTAVLLNDAIAPDDFRFDYSASSFLVKYPIADSNVAVSWRYLGCTHDPECDPVGMRSELDSQFLPAEVEEIIKQSQQIEQGKMPLDFLAVSSFNPTGE